MNCIDKNLDIVYISSSKSNFHKEYGKMKKIFLAALTAMALCSYSYAQDDEDEYEEDEAPAAAAPAPAPAASESSSAPAAAPAQSGAGFFGLGLDLTDAIINGGVQKFYATIKVAPNMELSIIFGLYHHGETTTENKASGGEVDKGDDYTQLSLGVGFDMFIAQILLPISVGGELIYTHPAEDNMQLTLNAWAGFRASLVASFYLTGKVGLGFDYYDVETATDEDSRLDVGFKTQLQLHWFFM